MDAWLERQSLTCGPNASESWRPPGFRFVKDGCKARWSCQCFLLHEWGMVGRLVPRRKMWRGGVGTGVSSKGLISHPANSFQVEVNAVCFSGGGTRRHQNHASQEARLQAAQVPLALVDLSRLEVVDSEGFPDPRRNPSLRLETSSCFDPAGATEPHRIPRNEYFLLLPVGLLPHLLRIPCFHGSSPGRSRHKTL